MLGVLRVKRVEWDEDINIEQVWEQVKGVIVGNAIEVCGSMRVGGKNPKDVYWNDVVKFAV